jgi:hypothetical protein
MRLIDKIALNRLISIIADLVIRLAKIFADKSPVNNPSKPVRPKPLKRLIDIVPLPWRK